MMTCHIYKRIEHAYTRNCCEKKEQESLFNNFYFSKEIFPCKRSDDDSGRKPAIKSKCNRLNCFNNTSCNNKITRPDQCGKNGKTNSNKNLALVISCVIH